MNWIPIIETPATFIEFLCYDDYYERIYLAYMNEEGIWTICHTDKMLRSVTHYMLVHEKPVENL
jgi:hypothetical protein